MSSISWYVDRYVHVGTSDISLVRDMAKRMKLPDGSWKYPSGDRKDVYREALRAHHDNQRLYRAVMSGRFG
jgi:hypothetical protein